MKKRKCVVCNKAKGKRGCILHNKELVCPRCCAEIRKSECGGCSYYQTAEKYNIARFKNSGGKKFIIEIDEEIEKEVDQALSYAEKKRFDEAGAILAGLIEKHPGNHMVQYGMGVLNALTDKFDDAIGYFQRAIEIFPYFVAAYFNMGTAYQKKLDVSNTVKSMQKVVAIGDPKETFVKHAKDLIDGFERSILKTEGVDLDTYVKNQEIFNQAVNAMERKDWERAIDGFQETLKVLKNHTQCYGNLGICLAKLGKKEQAIDAFNRALKIDPNYEPAIFNKMMTENLENGKILRGDVASIEYYKECAMKKSSTRSLDHREGMN